MARKRGRETNSSRRFVLAPPRKIGGKRQTREVIAGKKALCCEVAVGVEITLVDALGLREQADLAFRLSAQAAGLTALALRPVVIEDDLVVQLALAHGRAVETTPALAEHIERALDLVENLRGPVVVEPCRRGQLVADAGDELVGLGERRGAVRWVLQFPRKYVLDAERKLSIGRREVEYSGERFAEIRLGRFHPDGVGVQPHEVAVAAVDPRCGHEPRLHL